jgi:hypothetical protein
MTIEYNYLIFHTEGRNLGEPRVPHIDELVARASSLSEVINMIQSPELQKESTVILRFNSVSIGSIVRFAGHEDWDVFRLLNYPKEGGDEFLIEFRDQIASQEIILASLNMHNSIKLKDKESFGKSYRVIVKDKEQTRRILRNQLKALFNIDTAENIGVIKVLRTWWDAVRNDNSNTK